MVTLAVLAVIFLLLWAVEALLRDLLRLAWELARFAVMVMCLTALAAWHLVRWAWPKRRRTAMAEDTTEGSSLGGQQHHAHRRC